MESYIDQDICTDGFHKRRIIKELVICRVDFVFALDANGDVDGDLSGPYWGTANRICPWHDISNARITIANGKKQLTEQGELF